MKTFGGFLPLEIAAGGEPYHRAALGMASGRACWHAIVRATRPKRVRIPFYICDATLQPLTATDTPFEYYGIDERLAPSTPLTVESDELLLVVNYFGLLTPVVDRASTSDGARIVVDDTQAFFRRGSMDRWSFNSARKFFGVPDGAFLYGPAHGLEDLPPSNIADCEHLVRGLDQDSDDGWLLFRQHEARVNIELRAISTLSHRLLAAIDMTAVQRTRRENFQTLHRCLGARNTIAISFDDVPPAAPMCYPFLPEDGVERDELNRRGIFVPVLWPEIRDRQERGFDWERDIARRLLPLPIDQRYGPSEMQVIADTILQVLS